MAIRVTSGHFNAYKRPLTPLPSRAVQARERILAVPPRKRSDGEPLKDQKHVRPSTRYARRMRAHVEVSFGTTASTMNANGGKSDVEAEEPDVNFEINRIADITKSRSSIVEQNV